MAIGYAKKEDMMEHFGHSIEVAIYGDDEGATIECMDCGVVLIDEEEE